MLVTVTIPLAEPPGRPMNSMLLRTLFVGFLWAGISPGAHANQYADCSQLNDMDRRISGCQKIIRTPGEKESNKAMAYGNICNTLVFKKNYEDAMPYCTEALKKAPNAGAYTSHGDIYLSKQLYDLAIADYSKAIELKSDWVIAYQNRGIAYLNSGRNDDAIADLTKAIALKSNPNLPGAYYLRGQAYLNKMLYDAAIADEVKAIELRPDFMEAYTVRSNAYQAAGKTEPSEPQ